MLYIEDSDDGLWLTIAEVLSERQVCDMVVCAYPGEELEDLPQPFFVADDLESLERVTEISGGDEPLCSNRVPVSAGLIDMLHEYVGEFEDWGDSLLLYPPRERKWIAAFIPHQRVALVRDAKLKDFLDAAGITASTEPPPGWDRD